jgi:RHS repeat-associated protein
VIVVVTAPSAFATTANPTPDAGARRSATRINFPVSGTTGLSVDVGSGNALITDTLLTLPAIGQDFPIALSYNSSVWGNNAVPSSVDNAGGSGWGITGFDLRLISNVDGSKTFYGAGGLSGVFNPNGSGGFVTPAQFRADLATSGTGWKMTDHTSQQSITFNSHGRATKVTDRNGNDISLTYNGSGYPASITSNRGPSAGRTATITTTGGRITGLSQTSGTLSRSITIGWTSLGHLGSITDTVSGVTSFSSGGGGDTGQVVVITNPKSATTTLGFTSGKVSSVAQTNPSSHGGAGTSTTRLTYPSSTQTLLADPTTNQSSSVASVPHTTYTINADDLVTAAQDPNGNSQSQSYVSTNNIASTTPAAPSSGSTINYTYGANSGESLTQVASPTGATTSAAYTNTGVAAYLPSSSTDSASNTLNYTYDGVGNQLTSAQGTSGPQAVLTYNADGTVATSASPGAGTGVNTAYGYNTNHDLTSITPPSGTSLGSRASTWDGFGRLATATDGRGNTSTYTYDDADRITKIHSSASGMTDVDYTYDALNRATLRVDASGTTTYTYDDLNHPTSVVNTAGGGTVSYSYDLAGALATQTTGAGTTTYTYDNTHLLTSMSYPQSGGTNTTYFANDANGRRTDTWLQSNSAHTAWTAHTQFSYDSAGRVKTVMAENGPATSPTVTMNETLCYAAGSTPPSCPTTATADRANIAWLSDSVTGETSKYTYNADNRLSGVTVTGGGNPRTYTYGYDAAGNRTSSSVTGTSPTSQTLTYNAANQITSTGYSYDGAGNLTAWPGHAATYNGFQQQKTTVNGGVTTTYTYAGANQNELVSQATSGGNTYAYTYGRSDSNGLPQIERIDVSTLTGYIFHDNTGLPVMIQPNSGSTCLYAYDGIGSPIAVSTSASTTSYALQFDPYGAATRVDGGGSTGTWQENPYMYQGGIQDRATGNIKFGQRWYNTGTGAWTQQDSVNEPLSPGTANRYVYAAGLSEKRCVRSGPTEGTGRV